MNNRFPTQEEWEKRCDLKARFDRANNYFELAPVEEWETLYFGPGEFEWQGDNLCMPMPMKAYKDSDGEIVGYSMASSIGRKQSEMPKVITFNMDGSEC